MTPIELQKVENYFQKKFSNPSINLKPSKSDSEMASVLGSSFLCLKNENKLMFTLV